jgi:hypothetical protein
VVGADGADGADGAVGVGGPGGAGDWPRSHGRESAFPRGSVEESRVAVGSMSPGINSLPGGKI